MENINIVVDENEAQINAVQINPVQIVVDEKEDQISTPQRPIQLDKYPEIEPEIAWELANLIRIAGTDYQCFNDWFNKKKGFQEFTLEEGRELEGIKSNNSWIYAGKEINQTALEKYFLLNEKESKDENVINQFPDNSYYKYKILKTYEYVSYYPLEFRVDIDRFGFIAERQEGDKKIIFVVFRGTRELSEWFSNAQFKQVNFLETESNPEGIKDFGKISLGFNKMYTEFHPGIFLEHKSVNKISTILNDKATEIIERIRNFQIEEQSIDRAINDFFSNSKFNLDNTELYITGHSLGGALATIAALDIARKNKLNNPINLYTFASPRVGDNIFADKFNEFISKDKIKAFRFANSEDLVPKIPLPVWFRAGIELDQRLILSLTRSLFNVVTGGIFDKDYQHVGVPIYFTHQALRFENNKLVKPTATIGDNHNMTRTYCGALEKK